MRLASARLLFHPKSPLPGRTLPSCRHYALHKGSLIVIEGIDGAGKTTQCERLARRLREEGWDVERLREPTRWSLRAGGFANWPRRGAMRLPSKRNSLFLWKTVAKTCGRIFYPPSSAGLSFCWTGIITAQLPTRGRAGAIRSISAPENEKFAPPADLLIYLRIPAELAAERIGVYRNESPNLFEKEHYLRKVQAFFDAMNDPQLVRIDGTAEADVVFDEIWRKVMDFLNRPA